MVSIYSDFSFKKLLLLVKNKKYEHQKEYRFVLKIGLSDSNKVFLIKLKGIKPTLVGNINKVFN